MTIVPPNSWRFAELYRAIEFLLLLIVAPIASAQSSSTSQDSTAYCDSLCLVPLQDRIIPPDPPFMCDCMVIIGGGGSTGGGEALTAQQIIRRAREDYERRIANVKNYTVVQTTSSVPMPVVIYYEKTMIDEHNGTAAHEDFRQVSPTELSDHEAAANGMPTSEQMGEGMVTISGTLGGLWGGDSRYKVIATAIRPCRQFGIQNGALCRLYPIRL